MSSPSSPSRASVNSAVVSGKPLLVGSPKGGEREPERPAADLLVEDVAEDGRSAAASEQKSRPLTPRKSGHERPTEVSTGQGTRMVKSPSGSAVVSPSSLKTSLPAAGYFEPQHTFRRYAMPMLVGLVLAAIAIIVMTKGVIPWRNTERNYSYTSCSLAFPASSCSSNPNSTVCFAGAVAITPAVGTAFFGSNLCSVNGSEINTAGRSSGDKNSIQVVSGVASLGACENLTTVGTAGTWTPITSPTTVTIQCQLDKSTGLYNLDPVLTTSAHLVFVFCVIVFCIFALTTLLLWIPLYRIEHERFEWYCLTPRPGSKRRCGHFWALSPLWIVLTILLIVPLAVYYIVFLVIVVLIDFTMQLVGQHLQNFAPKVLGHATMGVGEALHFVWLSLLSIIVVWVAGVMVSDRLSKLTSSPDLHPRYTLLICTLLSAIVRLVSVALELRDEAPTYGSRAWRIAVCQSLCNIFILFLLRYLLVYVRQLRCILSGSPFTSASHWLVLGTSLLVFIVWAGGAAWSATVDAYSTFFVWSEGTLGCLFLVLFLGSAYFAAGTMCVRHRWVGTGLDRSSSRGVELSSKLVSPVSPHKHGYGTLDDSTVVLDEVSREAYDALLSRTNMLHWLVIVCTFLKGISCLCLATGLVPNIFGYPNLISDTASDRLIYIAVERLVLDEIPCVIILLLLRGLVPRMTKVSNAVDAAVKDEEYALRALASDRAKRRMHQDMSFDGEQDPFGHEEEEESAVDAEAKRRRDGKRGGSGGGGRSSSYVASFSEPDPPHTTSAIFPRLSIPVPAVPRRQSSGSVMSMSFSGSYPGNTSLEQLRRGLILPSPLIGASARESPYASGSDEYGRAYNSDPDLPSSMQ